MLINVNILKNDRNGGVCQQDYRINFKHAQRFKGKYEHNERINGKYVK